MNQHTIPITVQQAITLLEAADTAHNALYKMIDGIPPQPVADAIRDEMIRLDHTRAAVTETLQRAGHIRRE